MQVHTRQQITYSPEQMLKCQVGAFALWWLITSSISIPTICRSAGVLMFWLTLTFAQKKTLHEFCDKIICPTQSASGQLSDSGSCLRCQCWWHHLLSFSLLQYGLEFWIVTSSASIAGCKQIKSFNFRPIISVCYYGPSVSCPKLQTHVSHMQLMIHPVAAADHNLYRCRMIMQA
jgi:hypothetical protein